MKNKRILIFVCIVTVITVGIFLNIEIINESISAKKTIIYDTYQNKVISSEKDADGNDINEVILLRTVFTFDSLRSNIPIEYYYSNGTILFSEKELYPSGVVCGGGTILINDICRLWYSFDSLEDGETKRVVSGYTTGIDKAYKKIVTLEQKVDQLKGMNYQKDKVLDHFKNYFNFKGLGKDFDGLVNLTWSNQLPIVIKAGIGDSNGNKGIVITSEKITYTSACFGEDKEIPFSGEQWHSLINLIDMEKFYTLPEMPKMWLFPNVTDGTIRYVEIFDGVDYKSAGSELYDEPEMKEFVNELTELINCK